MKDLYEFDLSLCLTNFIGAIVKETEDAHGIEKKCICIPIEDNMINVGPNGSVYFSARVYRREYETPKGATHRIKSDLIAWKTKRMMEMGYKIPTVGALYRPWSLLNAYRESKNKYGNTQERT